MGLAGPSGSGKTAFSEKVRSFIPGCALLSMDNYNDASRLIDGNFDGKPLLLPPHTCRGSKAHSLFHSLHIGRLLQFPGTPALLVLS